MKKQKKNLDSRRIFIETLEELNDSKNIIITCDVGFNYLDRIKVKVLNLGVTEQSAAIIAATLALSGYTVWFYSMINFVLFRPAEMVRNAIVKHNANVKIIGVKGSKAYKFLGFSHNLLHNEEDINFCKNIKLPWHKPEPEKVKNLILKVSKENNPCYIRL